MVTKSTTGKGALGTVDGRKVVLGNATFMVEYGVDVAPLAKAADDLRSEGATAIFIGIDAQVADTIAIADPVKESTPSAWAALKKEGMRVVMLIGDNRTTTEARLGITEIEAYVLSEQRSAVVKKFKHEDGSSPWRAMASMTRRRWRRPLSG